jgi:hypothetical protein
MPANEPMKASQVGIGTWKTLPTKTPRASSISATESPISTEIVEASRIAPARTAATAMSLMPYLHGCDDSGVEAISGSAAVSCASLIALAAP